MTGLRKTIDYDSLPPLVPQGGDREAILNELVSKWGIPISEGTSGYTLERVALIDENTYDPIDIGEIIQLVEKTVQIKTPSTHAIRITECKIYSATLNCQTIFSQITLYKCEICGYIKCKDSVLLSEFNLDNCIVNMPAKFTNTLFCDFASFSKNKFEKSISFAKSTFKDSAIFEQSEFWGNTTFSDAIFEQGSHFEMSEFIGIAQFNNTVFTKQVWLIGTLFGKRVIFWNSSFSCPVYSSESLNAAEFSTNSRDSAIYAPPNLNGIFARFIFLVWTSKDINLHWGSVRGFGELSILTRVSTSALVLVPLLAAMWPSVRAGVEWYTLKRGHSASIAPYLPWGWGFLFFAALFVLIGRVIYQSKCPQEVRERSRVDVITDEMDEFRTTRDTEGDRRLSEAINAIEEAGTHELLRWSRHPNLVTNRDGRTVWIPSEIKYFQYDRKLVPPSWNQPQDGDEWIEGGVPQKLLAEPVMSQMAREDIAIRAGADARYDIIARQNRQWARAALWCYTLAVILVSIVIWKQAVDILHEMGWAWLTLENASGVTAWFCWGIIIAMALNLLLNICVDRPYVKLRLWVARNNKQTET